MVSIVAHEAKYSGSSFFKYGSTLAPYIGVLFIYLFIYLNKLLQILFTFSARDIE